MSYSFAVRAATKAEAREKIAAEFDRVEVAQACHVTDRPAAQAAAFAFVDFLKDDETKGVQVSVNGSLGGTWAPGNTITDLTQANVGVFASLVPKE